MGSEPVDLWPGVRAGLLEAGLVGASADAASPTLGRVLSFARYFGGAAAAAALAMLVWRPWVGDLTPPALSGTSEELVQQDNQQDETGPGAVAAAEFGGVGSGGLEAGRSLGDPRTLSVAAPVRPVSTAGSTPVSTNGGFSGTGRLVSAGFPGSVASSAGQPPAGHTHRELLHTGAGPGGAHPLIQGGLRRVGPGDELLRDAARIDPEGPIRILPGHSHGGSSWSLASDEAELR